jgi:hypothetical protein
LSKSISLGTFSSIESDFSNKPGFCPIKAFKSHRCFSANLVNVMAPSSFFWGSTLHFVIKEAELPEDSLTSLAVILAWSCCMIDWFACSFFTQNKESLNEGQESLGSRRKRRWRRGPLDMLPNIYIWHGMRGADPAVSQSHLYNHSILATMVQVRHAAFS